MADRTNELDMAAAKFPEGSRVVAEYSARGGDPGYVVGTVMAVVVDDAPVEGMTGLCIRFRGDDQQVWTAPIEDCFPPIESTMASTRRRRG